MKVITLASQKGGTGKSTLCMLLYHSFLKYSNEVSVCIVDLDPQKSITNLINIKELQIEVYHKLEPEKLKDYSIVLVDTPPRLTKDQNKIYNQSDLILIPSRTGMFDVVSTLQVCKTIEKFAPNTKKFVVLSQVNASTTLDSEVLAEFKDNDIKVFKSIIRSRLAYQRAIYGGGNIFDTNNQKAKTESTAIASEIYSILIQNN